MKNYPGKSHAELLAQARKRGVLLLYLTENKKIRGMIAHDDYFDYNNHYIDNFILKGEVRQSWLDLAEGLNVEESKELDLTLLLISELCRNGEVIFDWARALSMHPTQLYHEFIKFVSENVKEKFLVFGKDYGYDIPASPKPQNGKGPRPNGDGGQQPK